MTDDRRIRASASALAFGAVAAVAYLVQRLLDYARGAVVDPVDVLVETHTAFYWRCAAAAWWGGLAAVVAWVLSRRSKDPVAHARWLAVATVPLGILYVLLAWSFP